MPSGSPEVAYLDPSALVKVVVEEVESRALATELRSWTQRVSSRLSAVELVRAVRRRTPFLEGQAQEVLWSIGLLAVDDAVLARAARLGPASLRSLDAVHLATAIGLGAELGVFVTYDARQSEAARGHGLRVLAPT